MLPFGRIGNNIKVSPMSEKILLSFNIQKNVPAVGSGLSFMTGAANETSCISPLDDATLPPLALASAKQADHITQKAKAAFEVWKAVPAKQRAALLHTIAAELTAAKDDLAAIMTYEMGKPLWEAKMEVQNCIDTAHYAATLWPHIGGQSYPSARPNVQLYDTYHPLGPVLVITAFNFPYALWAWNAFIALACGNSVVWKPAPQTPLCAIAMHRVLERALRQHKEAPEGLLCYIIGDNENVAIPLVNNPTYPLVSATGSTLMGKAVGKAVGSRLGRMILELGGNAAGIITPSANLEQTLRIAFFSATLNGGQRCTALRRLMVHESIATDVIDRLKTAYNSWPVGNVFTEGHRLSALVDATAAEKFNADIDVLEKEGAKLFRPNTKLPKGKCWVHPYMALLEKDAPQPPEETFGPLLYVQPYSTLDEVLEKTNAVAYGLSNGIFSNDMAEIQQFLNTAESGCTMVNDNTGGPEVMLAFGGVKNSGVGTEKGGDSWKQYMRRQSVMLNYQQTIPNDLGINFG